MKRGNVYLRRPLPPVYDIGSSFVSCVSLVFGLGVHVIGRGQSEGIQGPHVAFPWVCSYSALSAAQVFSSRSRSCNRTIPSTSTIYSPHLQSILFGREERMNEGIPKHVRQCLEQHGECLRSSPGGGRGAPPLIDFSRRSSKKTTASSLLQRQFGW